MWVEYCKCMIIGSHMFGYGLETDTVIQMDVYG